VVDDAGERAELVLTTSRTGSSVVVAVAGELDAYSAPSLETLTARLQSEGCTAVTLDLSETTFVDSSALRTLLALHSDLETIGGDGLTLRAPSDAVSRLLTITGLTQHFTLS
jgi:anti-anti-sigma factor